MSAVRKIGQITLVILAVPIILVFLALLPLVAVGLLKWRLWLRFRYRLKWGRHGKPILFVYSDSPNWKQYIEEYWLPRITPHAVVLNWSQRSQWKSRAAFESRVFRHFAGREEFNPIAIFFPALGRVRIIRFWKPFKDFKHGRDRLLRVAERELFDVLAQLEDSAA